MEVEIKHRLSQQSRHDKSFTLANLDYDVLLNSSQGEMDPDYPIKQRNMNLQYLSPQYFRLNQSNNVMKIWEKKAQQSADWPKDQQQLKRTQGSKSSGRL